MNCDPKSLLYTARCFRCLPKPELNASLIYSLCQWANNLSPAKCRHATVDAWVDRVGANGGTTTGLEVGGTIYSALCAFCKGLDDAGLTAKMIAVNCFVPGSASPAVAATDLLRAQTPLITPVGVNIWTNTNFVPGDLTDDGLVGNGVNKHLSTGVIPSVAYGSTASAGLSLYVFTGLNENKQDFGCNSGTSANQMNLIVSGFVNAAFWDSFDITNGRITAANNAWAGFISGNRIAPNDTKLYRANSATALPFAHFQTGATSGGNLPTFPLTLFGINAGGAVGFITSRRYSFAAVHLGLNAAECNAFFSLVQSLRVSLGGGHV